MISEHLPIWLESTKKMIGNGSEWLSFFIRSKLDHYKVIQIVFL